MLISPSDICFAHLSDLFVFSSCSPSIHHISLNNIYAFAEIQSFRFRFLYRFLNFLVPLQPNRLTGFYIFDRIDLVGLINSICPRDVSYRCLTYASTRNNQLPIAIVDQKLTWTHRMYQQQSLSYSSSLHFVSLFWLSGLNNTNLRSRPWLRPSNHRCRYLSILVLSWPANIFAPIPLCTACLDGTQ